MEINETKHSTTSREKTKETNIRDRENQNAHKLNRDDNKTRGQQAKKMKTQRVDTIKAKGKNTQDTRRKARTRKKTRQRTTRRPKRISTKQRKANRRKNQRQQRRLSV